MSKVYGIKPDVTSLDEDLQNLRSNKFSPQAIKEIETWIFQAILKKPLPQSNSTLLETLKDGTVLCQLANILAEADNQPTIKWKESKMPFVQMEQIAQFLSFATAYGVPQDELFQTVDLFEEKDPASVYQTIKSVSRYANKRHPNLFPVIGPQIAEKHVPPKVPKKPKSLQGGAGWSTMEYGYMGGASQSTENVVFGNRRNIT
ncbi:hypothetical protein TBLA_0A04370 [Henningerozyma blattae CBS 6284]|uniref:Calponin-homology (CH) domain-containing protein n=1 Tax=Henningerozyma blattae (strain ATCC 34711 / CBS 6284 / DSM 70876 / NBRC 10599 / NRRL Y-10934 / UCD 77-7) TaxID=1071380 RepID=I2GVT0_HENB6|nr:hypothetical protein TBLA_0A04370 [Tetrapisispora blattae CBS 6284]CCH58232.1 hypothetical protein TBLA_0A04370 [Tetrapisispora blattae CBS 6284]